MTVFANAFFTYLECILPLSQRRCRRVAWLSAAYYAAHTPSPSSTGMAQSGAHGAPGELRRSGRHSKVAVGHARARTPIGHVDASPFIPVQLCAYVLERESEAAICRALGRQTARLQAFPGARYVRSWLFGLVPSHCRC